VSWSKDTKLSKGISQGLPCNPDITFNSVNGVRLHKDKDCIGFSEKMANPVSKENVHFVYSNQLG